MSTVLDVLLYDQKIGTITLLPGDSTLFVFEDSYISNPDRPILSQSFSKPMGDLVTEIRPYRTKLPPFFSNLLPEGPMRKYLAELGGVKPEREFHLLRLLGNDLPGAITIKDSSDSPKANTDVDTLEHKPIETGVYPVRDWQKIRDRNEALDCYVYARAAAAVEGLDRYGERHWQGIEQQLGIDQPPPLAAATEAAESEQGSAASFSRPAGSTRGRKVRSKGIKL